MRPRLSIMESLGASLCSRPGKQTAIAPFALVVIGSFGVIGIGQLGVKPLDGKPCRYGAASVGLVLTTGRPLPIACVQSRSPSRNLIPPSLCWRGLGKRDAVRASVWHSPARGNGSLATGRRFQR